MLFIIGCILSLSALLCCACYDGHPTLFSPCSCAHVAVMMWVGVACNVNMTGNNMNTLYWVPCLMLASYSISSAADC